MTTTAIARKVGNDDLTDQHGVFLRETPDGFEVADSAGAVHLSETANEALLTYAEYCDSFADSYGEYAEVLADTAAENAFDHEDRGESARAASLAHSAEWAAAYRHEAQNARQDAEAL